MLRFPNRISSMKYFLFFVGTLAIGSLSFGKSDGCRESSAVVYYANGMLVSPHSAEIARRSLASFLKRSFESDNVVKEIFPNISEVELAYNQTEGPLRDLMQSSVQKDSEAARTFWK